MFNNILNILKNFYKMSICNFSYFNSATSQRTSMSLGAQLGFATDQIHAPPTYQSFWA